MGPRASPSRTRSVSWCPRLGCSEQPFVVAGRGRAQLKYSAEDPSHSWAAGGEKPRDPKTTGRTRDRRRLGPGTGSKEAWEGRPLEADQDKEVPSRGARKKREQAAGIFFGPLTRETWRGLPYANRLRTPNEAFEIIRRLFHPPPAWLSSVRYPTDIQVSPVVANSHQPVGRGMLDALGLPAATSLSVS